MRPPWHTVQFPLGSPARFRYTRRVRTADFDYHLPAELIAQTPAARRDQSRLLVLERSTGSRRHLAFRDLTRFLAAGDVLVMNDSRVIPARLRGIKPGSGGRVELLLVEELAVNDWWVMLKPGKRTRPGTRFTLTNPAGAPSKISAEVIDENSEGHRRLRFSGCANLIEELATLGETPLPPYITRAADTGGITDVERYQTVYARPPGSVAAPTAGLHFTPELLAEIRQLGVAIHFVTLHVGLGTFAPVKVEEPAEHVMHEERFELPAATARAIRQARAAGRKVIAVGTTSVRVLETVAESHGGELPDHDVRGRTRIFLYPPRRFSVVDALLTNFHLPRSTLLMLVSALAAPGLPTGRELVLAAYAEAVRERYRFFSYGDAMLVL